MGPSYVLVQYGLVVVVVFVVVEEGYEVWWRLCRIALRFSVDFKRPTDKIIVVPTKFRHPFTQSRTFLAS